MHFKTTSEFLQEQGLSESFPARFFDRVNISDSCWFWTGYVMPNGYGTISKGGTRINGASCILAHRASWILHFGEIPHGLFVCHSCDCKSCVNPAHLWIGTHADNMRDMKRKGREAHNKGMFAGDKSYLAKLNWEIVREIRRIYRPFLTPLTSLARRYGVAPSVISAIVLNKTWVDESFAVNRTRCKIRTHEATLIREQHATGCYSQQALADLHGISQGTIRNIIFSLHQY